MMEEEIYSGHGVQFAYPELWEVTEHATDDEVIITVSSPATAFWCLTLFTDAPALERVAETIITAFRDEYHDVDVYEVADEICGFETVARDLGFFCLELTNTACVRAFATPTGAAAILYQANDAELAELTPIFERFTGSLQFTSSDVAPWADYSFDD